MNIIKSRIFAATLVALAVTGFTPAKAQQHEMTANLTGGLSTLTFKGKFGPGVAAGVGYSYFFFEAPLALTTGLSAGYFQSAYDANGLKSYDLSPSLTDEEGLHYELHSTLSGYHETQTLLTLNVPLMLHYLFPDIGDAGCIYTGFGVKFKLPISERYKAGSFTVNNVGHYPDIDGDATGPHFAGYGEFKDKASSGDFEFKPSVSLAAEVGWRFPLSEKTALYAGIYIDYGINDVRKDVIQPFVMTNPENRENFSTRSILDTGNERGTAIVSHVSPISFGVTVKFAFNSGATETKKKKSSDEMTKKLSKMLNDSIKAVTDTLRKEQKQIRDQLGNQEKKLDEQSKRLESIEDLLKRFASQREKQIKDSAVITRIDGFELNGYSLNSVSRADMEHNLEVLLKHPELRIIIVGYGDDLGSDAATMTVSRRRAEMVQLYLLDHGISPDRIIAVMGRGNQNPIVPNINEAYRRINRRVEITVRQ